MTIEGIEEVKLTNVREILDEYCEEFGKLYKSKLIADNKKATGNLIESVKTEITVSGTTVSVILNVADYYKWVELGRKPGKFPPIAKIQQWIKDKPIIPREIGGRLPTEKQLSYLISRKIANEGIEPGNQLKSTIDELNSIYIDKLITALKEDFGVYELKILDEIGKMIRL